MKGDGEQLPGSMKPASVEVTLREITSDTVDSILRLRVAEDQEPFFPSNAESIAQAHFSDHAWFRAIYAGETPVGFIMLYLDEEKPLYYLWRFMIDKKYQRQGSGSQAIAHVLEHIRGLPNAEELFLTYLPGEWEPLSFYQKFGFEETGEWKDDEKVMRLYL